MFKKFITCIMLLLLLTPGLPASCNVYASDNIFNTKEMYTTSNLISSQDIFFTGYDVSVTSINNSHHLMWIEESVSPYTNLRYMKVTNIDNPTPPITIINKSSIINYCSLINSNGNLYAYYTSFNGSNHSSLYFLKSQSNGDTWNESIWVADNIDERNPPSIVASERNIFIFWSLNNTIRWVKSNNYGDNWTTCSIIHTPPSYCSRLKAGINDEIIHLMWCDYRNYSLDTPSLQIEEIYHMSISFNGSVESEEKKVMSSTELHLSPALDPIFFVSHSNLLFSYITYKNIYVLSSSNNGGSWVLNNITNDQAQYNTKQSFYVLDNRIVNVVFKSSNSSWDLIISDDFGMTWDMFAIPITNTNYLSITLTNDRIYLFQKGYNNYTDYNTLDLTYLNWPKTNNNYDQSLYLVIGLLTIGVFIIVIYGKYRKKNKL